MRMTNARSSADTGRLSCVACARRLSLPTSSAWKEFDIRKHLRVVAAIPIFVAAMRFIVVHASTQSGLWTPLPAVPTEHGGPTATLLLDGKLLVAGPDYTGIARLSVGTLRLSQAGRSLPSARPVVC